MLTTIQITLALSAFMLTQATENVTG